MVPYYVDKARVLYRKDPILEPREYEKLIKYKKEDTDK
jgi:hypothetical protein